VHGVHGHAQIFRALEQRQALIEHDSPVRRLPGHDSRTHALLGLSLRSPLQAHKRWIVFEILT
jgi:hypothetical protein